MRAFHVTEPGYDRDAVVMPGRWGATLRQLKAGSSLNDPGSFKVALWEMALETARQAYSPQEVSRLSCLFAWEILNDAASFQNSFRQKYAIYEVEIPFGVSIYRGDFDLISSISSADAHAPYLELMPAVAKNYWVDKPAGRIEILVGGPVIIHSRIR